MATRPRVSGMPDIVVLTMMVDNKAADIEGERAKEMLMLAVETVCALAMGGHTNAEQVKAARWALEEMMKV